VVTSFLSFVPLVLFVVKLLIGGLVPGRNALALTLWRLAVKPLIAPHCVTANWR
jgi:hypothetical protein